MLRKTLASFLVFLIAVISVPIFIVFGLGRTYFNQDFYSGNVAKVSYDFLISQSVSQIYDNNTLIQANFTRDEFSNSIRQSFTQNMYTEVLNDFASQILTMVNGQDTALTLNLDLYRESLLTAMNTLAYKIYQKLPTCNDAQMASIKFGSDVPTCVPPKTDYDIVVSPFIQNFQNEVYQKIPKQISNIDQQLPIKAIQNFYLVKNVLFIILIVLLSLIALLTWRPFSSLVLWEGLAFFVPGLVGLGISFLNLDTFGAGENLPPDKLALGNQLLGFLTDEIRRTALIFLIIGVALIIIRMVIRRTIEHERISLR